MEPGETGPRPLGDLRSNRNGGQIVRFDKIYTPVGRDTNSPSKCDLLVQLIPPLSDHKARMLGAYVFGSAVHERRPCSRIRDSDVWSENDFNALAVRRRRLASLGRRGPPLDSRRGCGRRAYDLGLRRHRTKRPPGAWPRRATQDGLYRIHGGGSCFLRWQRPLPRHECAWLALSLSAPVRPVGCALIGLRHGIASCHLVCHQRVAVHWLFR